MANGTWQFVIVADPQECIILSHEAADIEKMAMQLDLEGQVTGAVEEYQRAVEKLQQAAEVCPEGHPDGQLLSQHARELLSRVEYLECLDNDHRILPLETHIHAAQLTLGSPEFLPEASGTSAWYKCAEARVMGAAAAMGATTGLLMLGPITGVAFGMATALATTREDKAGSAARMVGDVGVQLFEKTKKLNKEHKISHRVASVGQNAIDVTTLQTLRILKRFAQLPLANLA